jgi:hypothetical protein
MIVQEITKADNGKIYVITWEWRNGFNLTDSRPATQEEIDRFKKGDGLPVKL